MENSHKQDSIDSAIASNIAEIVDKITDRLNRGERPNLDEFAQGDKQLRRALQQIVNTLSLLREPDSACPSNGDQPTSTGQLGDFRILQEIGRGGMGVVYEAEQISIGRRVALKVLPFAAMLDKQQLNRFKNEARAAGTLNHPNIVAVHAVGTERGVHYYAMQLIEGQSLAEVIADRRKASVHRKQGTGDGEQGVSNGEAAGSDHEPHSAVCNPQSAIETRPVAALSTDSESNPQAHYRMVARLGIQAAEALEHAHRNGIVHRDVKPGNLLLDVDDNLYVTDFGLARLEADAGMTMTGDLLGTLPYMSPEQALAKRTIVDHRADVYSLGVTLYELVTLQKPYDGRDRQELLKKIAFEEPRRLRQINRCVSEDLETIIAKAIEKDPADRYASAQGLADDLRRYLNHEPIRARPPTVGDRFAKWSRRNVGILWVITAALAVVAVVCSVGALVLSASYREANRQRDLAHQEARTTRQLLYSADVRMAYDAWNAERLNLVRDLLARHIPNPTEEDLREFSWHYLWNLSHGGKRKLVAHEQDVFSIAYSPDGTTVATASKDGTAKLWNATTWELQHVLAGHESEVTAVRFSPTGEQVATASEDHTVRIWEVATGEELAVLANHTDDVLALDFSPDGALLASGGRDLQVRVWNAKSWKLARTLPAATNDIHSLRFSPDSAILVAGDADGAIHRWGVSDWTALPLMGSELSRPESEEKIFSLDCSPDSNWLAAAGRLGEVHVWKLGRDTPELQSSRHGHNGWIQSVAFSPLGDKVASGGRDGIIKIWNTHRQSDPPITLLGHTARVWSVAWSPDGRRLASAGADGTVIVWDVAHPAYSLTRTVSFPNAIGAAVISPNGQTTV
jgi:serine/threonine protein kinase